MHQTINSLSINSEDYIIKCNEACANLNAKLFNTTNTSVWIPSQRQDYLSLAKSFTVQQLILLSKAFYKPWLKCLLAHAWVLDKQGHEIAHFPTNPISIFPNKNAQRKTTWFLSAANWYKDSCLQVCIFCRLRGKFIW